MGAVGLVLAVILVNGWTDAPNAIATAVGSGAIGFRPAVALAAVSNLCGVVWMTMVSSTVAESLYSIADFGTLAGLCAALLAVVAWAILAWRFGIPTSESHALVAGLSGAALALPGGWSNLRFDPWLRVGVGLVGSVLLGLILGRGFSRFLRRFPPKNRLLRRAQIAGAAGAAFLHGAQDGQKFMGVFLLCTALAQGRVDEATFVIPLWLMVLCACCMALGTAVGGRRIVETVGRRLVPLSLREGLAADLGGGCALLLCTLAGLPVSTTHTKTAAILGAGSAGGQQADIRIIRSILLAWLLTFPGCGAVGFFMVRLLQRLG
ncbi:MAG: inorganic phosphate transporter [Oscillospiraceae bacterium]|nr:inorganic phosphate transporter [Oscillospiraceae bacterium]